MSLEIFIDEEGVITPLEGALLCVEVIKKFFITLVVAVLEDAKEQSKPYTTRLTVV